MEAALETRVKRLERATRFLAALCGVLFVMLAAVVTGSFANHVKAAEAAKVLRLKGLIIEDDQGHARILIGAPLPPVRDRVKEVRGVDIVFLDEHGHDRVAVGEAMPVVPGFHRVGSEYGLTIFDAKGMERGGMGFISNGNSVNRAVIGLDRPFNPSFSAEGWGAIVDDATGFAGTGYIYPADGQDEQEAILIGTRGNKAFVTFKDRKSKDRSTLAVTDGTPAFELFDEQGNVIRDLFRQH